MNNKFIVSLLFLLCLLFNRSLFSQNIAINTSGAAANASALLDMDASNMGLLIPRVALTITSSNAPIGAGVATSLLVYNTATVNDVTPGFYYWNGSWIRLSTGSGSGWALSGDALTGGTSSTPNEFIGSTNNYDWVVKTNNTEKMRVTAAGFVGIGTSISSPTQLLHLASNGNNTVMRYENPNVITSITPLANYTVGATYAGACVDDNTIAGNVAWTNPGNATTNNASYASAILLTTGSQTPSHYLKATNFGFAIPAAAVISGILVEWEKRVSLASATNIDNAVRIVKGGTIGATDKSNAADWSTSTNIYRSYGGAADLWGETWTPADINSPNFGAALSAKNTSTTSRTFFVDACRITVYYYTPAVNNVGNVDWTTGTDFSDFGKFKISYSSTLSSNNFVTVAGTGNVGIGTSSPDASALLDVSSATKGMRIPNVVLTGTSSALPVSSPVTSLLVYNTATVSDVLPGYYYWNGTKWVQLGGGWSLLGNSGTVDGTNFLGTTDNVPLNFRVNNVTGGRIAPTDLNVSLGYESLLTGTGYGCVAIGHEALKANDRSDDAQGYGWGNVAVGYEAMRRTTTGGWNTGCGNGTLRWNLSGLFNVALGNIALNSTTSSRNTGIGSAALVNNSTGSQNTAVGGGYQDFFWPNTVYATGDRVTTGYNNSFFGYHANVAVGGGAFSNATAIGALAQAGASNCLVLGSINGVNTATVSTNVGIGTTTPAELLEVNGIVRATGYRCRTGTAGAYGGNTFDINWTGAAAQLWIDVTNVGTITLTSDRRLKENIIPLEDNALSRLMKLRPVAFQYKKINDIFTGSTMTNEGFIADELQLVIPSAVNGEKDALTKNGDIQPQTLNLAPIVSVLTKAMQEQQKIIESQKVENAALKADFQALKLNTESEISKLKLLLEGMPKSEIQNTVPSPVLKPSGNKYVPPVPVKDNSSQQTINSNPAFSPAPPR